MINSDQEIQTAAISDVLQVLQTVEQDIENFIVLLFVQAKISDDACFHYLESGMIECHLEYLHCIHPLLVNCYNC